MTLNSHNEHETQLVCSVNRPISAIYRVSHIKLDRVKMGLNNDLEDNQTNFRRMNHFENFDLANKNFLAENARFFEYYMRIWALKIGESLI